jgi:hypothetical protein
MREAIKRFVDFTKFKLAGKLVSKEVAGFILRVMKKPYIKEYCKISDFVVWIVDGAFVRKNIDEEFTNFGQHYRFNFIPNDEFWIDEEHGKGDEEKYYIDHMLVENRLMAEGKSYGKAIERADAVEKKERTNALLIGKWNKKKQEKEIILGKIRLKLLKKYSGKTLKVWVVNGMLVRDLFFLDFTEGGHDKVYHFVPHGEVWIDDDVSPQERKFVLLHELHERNLMAKGMSYDSAHKSASETEYYCRKHPKETDRKIEVEMEKANKLVV